MPIVPDSRFLQIKVSHRGQIKQINKDMYTHMHR